MLIDAKLYDKKHLKLSYPLRALANTKVLYKGKDAKTWALELGITAERVRKHLKKHGHLDHISYTPPKQPIIYRGKTLKQWAKYLNYKNLDSGARTIRSHLKRYGNLDNITPYKKSRLTNVQ